jgi:hypothetical protein
MSGGEAGGHSVIRKVFKWGFRIGLLLVVLVVGAILSLDYVLKKIAEHRIQSETGMEARIGRLSVGLLTPYVTIENLKIYNTAEFGGTVFLDIPEMKMEYDRVAMAHRELRITLMRFNLAELSIVRNQEGRTNITSLMTQSAGSGSRKDPKIALGDIEFKGIEILNLTLGKVRFVDLKEPAKSRELKMNVRDYILKNVKSETDFYGVLALVWLRSGFSLGGDLMKSPPQIFSLPQTAVSNAPAQNRP